MTVPLVVGLDASTSGVKAVVVDPRGRVVAEGRAALGLDNPGPDAWEQDARAWLDGALVALEGALGALDARARAEVRAIAIAHQRETFVVTNERGEPRAPAVVWMDARCRPEVGEVVREVSPEELLRRTGKVPCTTPSLYKIRALLGRIRPELRDGPRSISDVGAFLGRHLAGAHATSRASADPLGLVELSTGDYAADLCELAHVRPTELARLVAPGAPIGPLLPAIVDRLGLGRGTLLVAGAGDGQAAGLGAGVVAEGDAYLNVGTALVSGAASSTPRTSRAFRTLYSAIPGDFVLETDLKGGTFTLDWLADRLLGGGYFEGGSARAATLAALEAQAEAIAPGSDGLLALPYWAGVMNPHWDDDASGALVGLRGDHGPAHVYRAILEGLAFEQRWHFEGVEAAFRSLGRIVGVGGGMRRPLFARIVADALDRPLERSLADETTALGAAMLAAAGAGVHSSVGAAARAMAAPTKPLLPGPAARHCDRVYRAAYRPLYSALAPTLGALAALRELAPSARREGAPAADA
jgi:xylulokinase